MLLRCQIGTPHCWLALPPSLCPTQILNPILQDLATHIVELQWPSTQSRGCETVISSEKVPLRDFIQEILRRSRASYCTMKVALYYLILLAKRLGTWQEITTLRTLRCGRRMFLTALVLAWKYLHDCQYSMRAWSMMSGLSVGEINTNESAFLTSIDWRLHITGPDWARWQKVVLQPSASSLGAFGQGF